MKGKKLMAMLMAGSLLLAGLTGCGGATAKGGGAAASADDYPNGPVTIICPWGVGGGADVISRKISGEDSSEPALYQAAAWSTRAAWAY